MKARISLMRRLVRMPRGAWVCGVSVLMRMFLNFLVEMLREMAGLSFNSGECEVMTSFMMWSTSLAMQDGQMSKGLTRAGRGSLAWFSIQTLSSYDFYVFCLAMRGRRVLLVVLLASIGKARIRCLQFPCGRQMQRVVSGLMGPVIPINFFILFEQIFRQQMGV